MQTSISRPGKLPIVDALRGVAAVAVAWFHFTNGNKQFLPAGFLKSTGSQGWLGVEVFFVVSGFVIPYSLYRGRYKARAHWKRFLAKRIIRLDPPYLACIVLSVGLAYLSMFAPGFHGTAPHFTLTQLLLHLGYLNAFFGYEWVNPVFWTLAVEFQFYLLMAFVYGLVANSRESVRLVTLGGLVVLGMLVPGTNLVFQWLPLFGLGMITFQRAAGLTTPLSYSAMMLAMTGACYFILGPMVTVVGLSTALMIAFVRLPSFKSLSSLGAVSYSLYLLHVPIGGRVVNLGTRVTPTLLNEAATLLLALTVSLAFSYLLYRSVELPAQRWSSSLRYAAKETGSPLFSAAASAHDPQLVEPVTAANEA